MKILMTFIMMLLANIALSQIQVRKAFETGTKDDDKAANLSFTLPKDGKSYYAINAGIGYEFGKVTKQLKQGKIFGNSFSGFFVFNRNNQIDKEQKNYKLGVSSNQIFYRDTANTTAIFGFNTVEYLRDYMDESHSLLLTTYWNLLSKKKDNIKLGGYASVNESVVYFLLPQLGLEYQNAIEAKDKLNEGSDFRGFFSLGTSFLVKKKSFDQKTNKVLPKNKWIKGLELKFSYEGRYSLLGDLNKTSKYMPLFKSEIVFYPVKDDKFSIGLSYDNGANPLDGLGKQQFWLFALKFKK